jgi:hypothetical protein
MDANDDIAFVGSRGMTRLIDCLIVKICRSFASERMSVLEEHYLYTISTQC